MGFKSKDGSIQTIQGDYDYERVEASATDQVLGATGAAGDFLHKVIPDATTGTIIIKDNATTILTIPAAYEVGKPIELNVTSVSGAFTITTAASTSCLCIGKFS